MCVTPLFFFLWGGKRQLAICTLAGAIYTYPSVRVSLVWVTSFAWVALLSAVSNKSASVRQKPASCSATACALPHIPHASQGYLSKQLRKRQNPCSSCAGIISSCHLWGLGGGGQLLSPSPACHVESSPPFSLQTARLA